MVLICCTCGSVVSLYVKQKNLHKLLKVINSCVCDVQNILLWGKQPC